ncbi:hypothetical protein [Saccharospirillum salsuginis]|uniref:Scaffold protein FimL second domain-containing protein n=1 Tax=Saccharospirillum salsuginis TaxID=418750 RepID=A0A918K671_9GAMM|nr:hypothetical protein [Saccharospirillum salsuginis]GGX51250.1 hypothetical protein GCM10007392_18110 [Saccharospirillum salsuginis]
MSTATSKEAIKTELEATLQQAQSALESFSDDTADLSQLEQAQDLIGQTRGIFQVLEEPGAVSLCDEFNALINAIPTGESGDSDQVRPKLDAISQGLVVLNRYLEFLSLGRKAIPAVLLPTMNNVRKARGVSGLGEGHFFQFSFKPGKPPTKKPFQFSNDVVIQLKKFRHMYQAGLLHLIRGERTAGAFRYMGLALNRIDQLLANAPCAPLWWVASGALESMAQRGANMTGPRKLLFAHLDRHLKDLIRGAPKSLERPPSLPLMKEFLFLLALNKSDSLRARQVAKFYRLPELSYTEDTLEEQRQMLFSPGRGVLSSVSEALKEDIAAIKEIVDQAARHDGGFSARALQEKIAKVADVYVMLGLQSPANVLKQQAAVVADWADNAAPTDEQLLKIADAVLYAESALSRVLQGQRQLEGSGDNKAAQAQLHEARVVLIDEAEAGLALAKRAITAYMDSQGDKLHLANVVPTLRGVKGAFVFLDSMTAADLIERAIRFIERDLSESGTMVDPHQLEAFADALSSLEFFLEGLLNDTANEDILKLAKHSLASLSV